MCFDLWTLLSDRVQTSGLNRAGCGDADRAEDPMSFGQGCLLRRAAILTNLPRVSA